MALDSFRILDNYKEIRKKALIELALNPKMCKPEFNFTIKTNKDIKNEKFLKPKYYKSIYPKLEEI